MFAVFVWKDGDTQPFKSSNPSYSTNSVSLFGSPAWTTCLVCGRELNGHIVVEEDGHFRGIYSLINLTGQLKKRKNITGCNVAFKCAALF